MFMKPLLPFGVLISLAAAGSVIEPRDVSNVAATQDVSSIAASLDQVGRRLDIVVSDFNTWRGSSNEANRLLEDFKDVNSEIENSRDRISKSDSVASYDTVRLYSPANSLVSKFDSMVNAVLSKRRQLDGANISTTVRNELEHEKDGMDKIYRTLVGKIPVVGTFTLETSQRSIQSKLVSGIQALGPQPQAAAAPPPRQQAPPQPRPQAQQAPPSRPGSQSPSTVSIIYVPYGPTGYPLPPPRQGLPNGRSSD